MFVFTYAVFYNFIHDGACSLKDFTGIVRWLIMTYGIVLIMQQICMLIGIRFFPIINLIGQGALSLSKLNSLSIEPSHSARILTALMLCYLRCHEISNGSNRLMLKELFSKGHRTLTFLFLWTMLTMGSGTAFIGLGILCLYFIQRKTWFYIVPLIALLLCIGQAMKLKQLDRATRIVNAVTTGDVKIVQREDGSAASRITPIINTLTIDLTKKDSWVGKGTSSYEQAKTAWMRTTDKIAVVEQYGLIALFFSLVLIYRCSIFRFFSIETLIFTLLLGFSMSNIAYTWGIIMLFTVIRYFQESTCNQ